MDSGMLAELLCSGIGRTLALQYAAAGVKLCIVGRRQSELDMVKAECLQAHDAKGDSTTVLSVVGDFTDPEDMVRVRTEIETGTSTPSLQGHSYLDGSCIESLERPRYCHCQCRCLCDTAFVVLGWIERAKVDNIYNSGLSPGYAASCKYSLQGSERELYWPASRCISLRMSQG